MNFTLDAEMIKNLQPLIISYSAKVITALLIFIIGKWIARSIANLIIRLMRSRKIDVTLISFLEGIIYYTLLTSVVIAAAGQLGIKTTSFLAVLGAASLAIGLALKDSLANFSSGVMLILFRPFQVGDVVVIGGETGKVQAISVFSTILYTGDNQKKIIPNGAISNSTITNITANPTRRVDITIGIGYDDDIRKAKEVLNGILAQDTRILADPAPAVVVESLGASSVDLVARSWVATADYWDVLYSLNEQIKLTFDDNGISIPYPQQDVHLFQVAAGK